MFRIKIAMLILGGVLAYFGIQEFRVGMGSSTKPEAVDLAELENGTELTNNHVLIGEHVSDYAGVVYEYEEGSNKVTHAYYPIISESHRFFSDLNKLAEKYPKLSDVPENEFPVIDDFKVLVKTKRFKTVSTIPEGLGNETKLQGLVINLVSSIKSEEKKLIKQAFPHFDSENVYVVEEGRKPTSMVLSIAMIAGGLLLALGGLAWMFAGSGS
jgi:hypothetical protein